MHIYRGNVVNSRHLSDGGIAKKSFQDLKVDRYDLEYDIRRAEGFEALKSLSKSKNVVRSGM